MFDSFFKYFSPQQFIDIQNFKRFLIDNNIIATTAGVLIAYSAWDFIQSFVGDIILPGIYFLFIGRFFKGGFVSSVFEPVNRLNIPKFISRFISFTIVITLIFLFIQNIIKNWIPESQQPHNNNNVNLKGNVVITNSPNNISIDLNKNMKYSDFDIENFRSR
jgi:large-conductance mechanosensitive channel